MKDKSIKNKLISVFIFIFIAMIFSGCVTVSIKGEITTDMLAIYQGDILLSIRGFSSSQTTLAHESLLKLKKYWQSIGYESEVSLDNTTYHLYFKKQLQCTSFDEAFEELHKLMTDQYSPFSSLSYVYSPYDNYSEYTIEGRMDISDMMDMDAYSTLQDNIKETIDDEMKSLDATIIFILPNQEDFSQPLARSSTFSTVINPNTPTDISIAGKINNAEVLKGSQSVIDNYNYYNTLTYVLIGISLILFIIMIFAIKKLKK